MGAKDSKSANLPPTAAQIYKSNRKRFLPLGTPALKQFRPIDMVFITLMVGYACIMLFIGVQSCDATDFSPCELDLMVNSSIWTSRPARRALWPCRKGKKLWWALNRDPEKLCPHDMAAFDNWSFQHFSHGPIFWILLFPFTFIFSSDKGLRVYECAWLLLTLALTVGWEIFENSEYNFILAHRSPAAFITKGDSIINSLTDTLMVVISTYICIRFGFIAAIVVFVAMEAVGMALSGTPLTYTIIAFLAGKIMKDKYNTSGFKKYDIWKDKTFFKKYDDNFCLDKNILNYANWTAEEKSCKKMDMSKVKK